MSNKGFETVGCLSCNPSGKLRDDWPAIIDDETACYLCGGTGFIATVPQEVWDKAAKIKKGAKK